MTRVLLATALLAAACTKANPDFAGGDDDPAADGGPDGGRAVGDGGAGVPDAGCAPGDRACRGADALVCEAVDGGTALVLDRSCPGGAECRAGRCVAGADPRSCARELDCLGVGDSCGVLVDDNAERLDRFCIDPVGDTAGGLACSDDATCRSGLCLRIEGRAPRCYLACDGDGDCPVVARCSSVRVTVTGVQGTIKACVPR